MGVSSLPKTATRQRRDCDLNPGLSAPESSTLTTRLPSHPYIYRVGQKTELFLRIDNFLTVIDKKVRDKVFKFCIQNV